MKVNSRPRNRRYAEERKVNGERSEEGEKGGIAMNKREEGWNKDEQDKEEDEYEVRNQNRRRRDNREGNQTKNEEWEKVKNRFSKEKIKPKKDGVLWIPSFVVDGSLASSRVIPL